MARFADDLVPETSLAYALRWGVVTERLLDRSGEGSLAAVMLFRLLLDRCRTRMRPRRCRRRSSPSSSG
jgi:hypothetical protein